MERIVTRQSFKIVREPSNNFEEFDEVNFLAGYSPEELEKSSQNYQFPVRGNIA